MLVRVLIICIALSLTHPYFVHGVGWELLEHPEKAAGDKWCYQPLDENSDCVEKNGGWSKGEKYLCDKDTSKRQTPIDLDPNIKASEEKGVTLTNADKYVFPEFTMTNTGHTFSMSFIAPDANFNNNVDDYNLVEFHFHWGPTDDCGSEHAFNGRSFSMELHLVHLKKDHTKEQALNDATGVSVIGLLIQAVPGAGPCIMDDLQTHYLANKDALSKVNGKADITGSGLTFASILKAKAHAYHYKGSLTTPPCSEAVVWYVRQEVVSCKPETIATFRTAMKEKDSDKTKHLQMSFRRLQHLNDRDVQLIELNP